MDVRLHHDRAEFEAVAGPLYAADPVRHTLGLTVTAGILHDPAIDPVMLTVHRDGALYGAVVRTPPWPFVVSGLPLDAAPAAVAALADADPLAPGVNGPRELAEGFAQAWAAHTGAGLREALASRLYELGDLLEPSVPGTGRTATEADLPLLLHWRRDFQLEALGHDRGVEHGEHALRREFAHGDHHELWEFEGEVVSWARAGAPKLGMSRVAPVYTPKEFRARGFGSAVTAAVSRWAREAGAEHVLLFTDLANPTANSIYQKLGYRPVLDTCEIEFTGAD